MNKLTTAQKQKLKPIEPFLRQSLANYLVNQTIENKEIVFAIHRQVFGGDLGKPTCPTCVLKTYRRIAELYFAPKEKEEKPAQKEQTSQDAVETPSKEEKPEVIETIKEEQKVHEKEKEHAPVKSEKTTKKK